MQKVRDYVHVFEGLWDDPGKCRVRVYRASIPLAPVVSSFGPPVRPSVLLIPIGNQDRFQHTPILYPEARSTMLSKYEAVR